MSGIDWSDCAPISVLIDKPTARSQKFRHAADCQLLLPTEPEEQEPRADEIERAGAEGVQRVFENVVPAHFEVRNVESLEAGEIDIGRNHMAARSDLLRQPNRHRSASGAYVEAPPAGPNEITPSARSRVEEFFQKSESLILGLKGSSEELREKIFSNMSQRAAAMLKEDLEAKGMVRVSEVEAQQKEILGVVRRLADEGQITLGAKGGEGYV